jgi:hypothetical protein
MEVFKKTFRLLRTWHKLIFLPSSDKEAYATQKMANWDYERRATFSKESSRDTYSVQDTAIFYAHHSGRPNWGNFLSPTGRLFSSGSFFFENYKSSPNLDTAFSME